MYYRFFMPGRRPTNTKETSARLLKKLKIRPASCTIICKILTWLNFYGIFTLTIFWVKKLSHTKSSDQMSYIPFFHVDNIYIYSSRSGIDFFMNLYFLYANVSVIINIVNPYHMC